LHTSVRAPARASSFSLPQVLRLTVEAGLV
jgi:hypothetical protein